MSIDSYIRDTGLAVNHLFVGLNEYNKLKLKSICDFLDKDGYIVMSEDENEEFIKKYQEYYSLEIAKATLAGSILQVACVGIDIYSETRNQLNEEYIKLGVKSGGKTSKYCIGKIIKGIPEGLLIYAGRIQYNHWGEGEPNNEVAKNIFMKLESYYYQNPLFDLAYCLGWNNERPISHFILQNELEWNTYDDYLISMKNMQI
jgi:hypothetical protein